MSVKTKAISKNVWLSLPWQAFAGTVLVLPSLAVVMVRATQGSTTPVSAVASSPDATKVTSVKSNAKLFTPMPKPQESTLRTLKAYEDVLAMGFGDQNPLKLAPVLRKNAGSVPSNSRGDRPESISFPDTVHLTTIFVTKDVTTAVVGGMPVGIGDVVADVWQVVEIDPVEQVVTLRHPTGFDHRLTLRKADDKPSEPTPRGRPRR